MTWGQMQWDTVMCGEYSNVMKRLMNVTEGCVKIGKGDDPSSLPTSMRLRSKCYVFIKS